MILSHFVLHVLRSHYRSIGRDRTEFTHLWILGHLVRVSTGYHNVYPLSLVPTEVLLSNCYFLGENFPFSNPVGRDAPYTHGNRVLKFVGIAECKLLH